MRSWANELSFRAKLTAGICAMVLITGAAVTWLAHRSAKKSTESLARSLFRAVSSHAATETQSYVFRAAPLVDSLVHFADDDLALDLAGHSTYCDETGGDYYDFLILDEAEPPMM